MASSSASAAVFLLSVLSILAVVAAGRPCKTFFISYTVSSSSVEVAQISAAGDQTAPRFFAFYRVIPLRYNYRESSYPTSSSAEPLRTSLRLPVEIERAEPSFGVGGSLRERARDILVVVAGLLFGVGCGALTSATLYLVCYLYRNRGEVCGSHGYDYDDDVESPKKRGYTDLPAAPATPVTPLKEGYEGN